VAAIIVRAHPLIRVSSHALLSGLALCLLAACASPREQTVHVAVAANFTEAAREIAQLFEQKTGNRVLMSFGSTGQLFTQITQGAPFEVFLSADDETPRKIAAAGLGVPDSVFTYAIGRLALCSSTLDLTDGASVLRAGKFQKIALANPTTAPYGAAAMEALKSLQLDTVLREKIVQGNNITQAFQFVETGNAEVGFVAWSQIIGKDAKSFWIVPQELYAPIRQDAVLLKADTGADVARTFIEFVKSAEALEIIEKYGYSRPR
jgi:molybdate transport system substrate-binding protein